MGVALGLLVFTKLVFLRRPVFGESMMFLYYAYFFPMSLTIGRGFYEDGIWAETSFIPYNEVGGISWREGEQQVTLIVISRLRNLARRLTVPGDKYGAARRLLRDKIGEHAIRHPPGPWRTRRARRGVARPSDRVGRVGPVGRAGGGLRFPGDRPIEGQLWLHERPGKGF